MSVYLDRNVVVYHVERTEPWAAIVGAAFGAREHHDFEVSDLVRLECRVAPLRRNDAELLARFEEFFRSLRVLPVTAAVFDRAAELRARHRLKTPDALHLATALEHGCDEFWTNDNRLGGIPAALAFRSSDEA